MRESIILWTAAVIIVFIFGYLQRLTSPEYPISATIGIDGKAVTYSFDKVCRCRGNYITLISTELKDSSIILQWKETGEDAWHEVTYKSGRAEILSAGIPHHKPFSKIYYRTVLNYNNKQYYLPSEKPVQIEFLNFVPLKIFGYYYFFLFGGLILAVRSGLEIFHEVDHPGKPKNRIKMYSIFTSIFFFVFAFAFTPIKRIYEAGEIGTIILPITYVFQWWSIGLFILSISVMIFVFNLKKNKNVIMAGTAAILILFLIQNFI